LVLNSTRDLKRWVKFADERVRQRERIPLGVELMEKAYLAHMVVRVRVL
jgi:hypothetical protein